MLKQIIVHICSPIYQIFYHVVGACFRNKEDNLVEPDNNYVNTLILKAFKNIFKNPEMRR